MIEKYHGAVFLGTAPDTIRDFYGIMLRVLVQLSITTIVPVRIPAR
jgi:hypothetical protein